MDDLDDEEIEAVFSPIWMLFATTIAQPWQPSRSMLKKRLEYRPLARCIVINGKTACQQGMEKRTHPSTAGDLDVDIAFFTGVEAVEATLLWLRPF
jgi:hypothetical protein